MAIVVLSKQTVFNQDSVIWCCRFFSNRTNSKQENIRIPCCPSNLKVKAGFRRSWGWFLQQLNAIGNQSETITVRKKKTKAGYWLSTYITCDFFSMFALGILALDFTSEERKKLSGIKIHILHCNFFRSHVTVFLFFKSKAIKWSWREENASFLFILPKISNWFLILLQDCDLFC